MIPAATLSGGGRMEQGHPGTGRPFTASVLLLTSLLASVLLFANFLAGALASERGFHAFLLTGFQVEGVALDFFDDVFLLHFALETAQSVLQGFTLLQSNFRQTQHPQTRPEGPNSYYKELTGSQVGSGEKMRGRDAALCPRIFADYHERGVGVKTPAWAWGGWRRVWGASTAAFSMTRVVMILSWMGPRVPTLPQRTRKSGGPLQPRCTQFAGGAPAPH